MDCVMCGKPMDLGLAPATTHPACLFAELDDRVDPAAQQLKSELIEIIRWHDGNSPRSKQQMLGPSEIGTPCDRRLGYRIAEVEPVNTHFDPWAAIVGTAIHSWLDEAITAWCRSKLGDCDWKTETPVVLDNFVKGRSDCFHNKTVIDHKGAGPDVMTKVRKQGPPAGYVVQVQLYGYGYQQLGFDVEKVALAFYPRAGWLKDMYVWVAPYDEKVAVNALDRVYATAETLSTMDVLGNPHRWEQVAHTPGRECGFCPWYDPGRDAERGADNTGCPGR